MLLHFWILSLYSFQLFWSSKSFIFPWEVLHTARPSDSSWKCSVLELWRPSNALPKCISSFSILTSPIRLLSTWIGVRGFCTFSLLLSDASLRQWNTRHIPSWDSIKNGISQCQDKEGDRNLERETTGLFTFSVHHISPTEPILSSSYLKRKNRVLTCSPHGLDQGKSLPSDESLLQGQAQGASVERDMSTWNVASPRSLLAESRLQGNSQIENRRRSLRTGLRESRKCLAPQKHVFCTSLKINTSPESDAQAVEPTPPFRVSLLRTLAVPETQSKERQPSSISSPAKASKLRHSRPNAGTNSFSFQALQKFHFLS